MSFYNAISIDIHIDAKAREAYSTGQNVYVPSPQVSDVYVHMQVPTYLKKNNNTFINYLPT